jgi:hypothetical protein
MQELTRIDVLSVVEQALARGTDSRVVAEFVASVDWTRAASASDEIRALVGNLEGWTTELDEGDISRRQYRARLQKVFASPGGPRPLASPARR